jgi:hypothetical protein
MTTFACPPQTAAHKIKCKGENMMTIISPIAIVAGLISGIFWLSVVESIADSTMYPF